VADTVIGRTTIMVIARPGKYYRLMWAAQVGHMLVTTIIPVTIIASGYSYERASIVSMLRHWPC